MRWSELREGDAFYTTAYLGPAYLVLRKAMKGRKVVFEVLDLVNGDAFPLEYADGDVMRATWTVLPGEEGGG